MADIEHIGLLIDGKTLYGVAVGADLSGTPEAWDFGTADDALPDIPAEDVGKAGESVKEDSSLQRENIPEKAAEYASLAEVLTIAGKELGADDGCVLALPPDVLVTKVISLPPVEPEAIPAMVRLQMEKFAPVSGDALEVASEVVGATEDSTRVFAVAMPMSKLESLAEDLAKSEVKVSRIDSSLLCQWRMFTDCEAKPELAECYAVLFVLPSGRYDLVIADQSGPVFARTIGKNDSADELVRETVLSVLNLGEDFNGLAPSQLTVVSATPLDEETMARFTAALGVETAWLDSSLVGDYVNGVVRRDAEEGHIDIVPEAWRDVEKQSVAKGRFMTGIYIALFVWLLAAAAICLAPKFVQRRVDAIDKAVTRVTPAYRSVSDTRTKVRLIRAYQDRSRSLLDVLRAVCADMPEGIVFSSISYEKGGELLAGARDKTIGGIKIVGDADRSATVLAFKDVLDSSGMFVPAKLTGPIMDSKRQRYKFEIDSRFTDEEAEQ